MSDFRRDNATRLWGYNRNAVNNDNFNMTGAVNSLVPIPSALIAFSNRANLENSLFETFISVTYFDVLVLNIIPELEILGTKCMGLGSNRTLPSLL